MTAYLARFTLTERLLHWVHATAFFIFSALGSSLYLPVLTTVIGRRPLVKSVHIWTASLGRSRSS